MIEAMTTPELKQQATAMMVAEKIEDASDVRLLHWLLAEPEWTEAQVKWVTALVERDGARFK